MGDIVRLQDGEKKIAERYLDHARQHMAKFKSSMSVVIFFNEEEDSLVGMYFTEIRTKKALQFVVSECKDAYFVKLRNEGNISCYLFNELMRMGFNMIATMSAEHTERVTEFFKMDRG